MAGQYRERRAGKGRSPQRRSRRLARGRPVVRSHPLWARGAGLRARKARGRAAQRSACEGQPDLGDLGRRLDRGTHDGHAGGGGGGPRAPGASLRNPRWLTGLSHAACRRTWCGLGALRAGRSGRGAGGGGLCRGRSALRPGPGRRAIARDGLGPGWCVRRRGISTAGRRARGGRYRFPASPVGASCRSLVTAAMRAGARKRAEKIRGAVVGHRVLILQPETD